MNQQLLKSVVIAAFLSFASVASAQWPASSTQIQRPAASSRPVAAWQNRAPQPASFLPQAVQPRHVASYRPAGTYAYVPPNYWRAARPEVDQLRPIAEDEDSLALDVTIGTQFPLGIGPRLSLELPGRLLLQGEVAWMPQGYATAVLGMASPEGEDARRVVGVIENALGNSFVGRVSAGWRPFRAYGFELTGGYTHIAVSGSAQPSDVAPLVDGVAAKALESLSGEVNFGAALHNVHVAVGWRWLAADDHLVIRANLGYMQTLSASSAVELPPNTPFADEVKAEFSQATDTLLEENVKAPLVGLSLGYRI